MTLALYKVPVGQPNIPEERAANAAASRKTNESCTDPQKPPCPPCDVPFCFLPNDRLHFMPICALFVGASDLEDGRFVEFLA
jgi:hypothetical protein